MQDEHGLSMSELLWLRAESKGMEARSALTPGQVSELIAAGFEVVVERSAQRAISDKAFADSGCRMSETGSWVDAPAHAWVLGLKELPDDGTPLSHRHIYFAHAYKGQPGWQDVLRRFKSGGGELFDLEYLNDASGRRVAAFGYWAGYTGCAIGMKTWAGVQLGYAPVIPAISPYPGRNALLDELRTLLDAAIEASGNPPRIMIIGARGRVGAGARKLAEQLELEVTAWDLEETAAGGPFHEILEHDVFVNCVLVQEKIPAFIDSTSIMRADRKLSVICDVSCDPGPLNPIPLYQEATTFHSPVLTIIDSDKPLYLSAIDHLPSMLPVESSEDFGAQLLPHLLTLKEGLSPVWQRALSLFEEKSKQL